MTAGPDLDPEPIVRTLTEHGVRYVVIGAFAALAQEAPIGATQDIDFTPDPDLENLARLSDALRVLDARIRTVGVPGGLPFNHNARSLLGPAMFNLTCRFGDFDLAFTPAAFPGGYVELAPHSHTVMVGDVSVEVADLDDIIRSKETAGRPKDLAVLPILIRFRDERRRRPANPEG